MDTRLDFRLEGDSLGEVRVPHRALYGAQTTRAIENFPISGSRPWPTYIWVMAAIKRDALAVNGELGLIDPDRAYAISFAAQEAIDEQWSDLFVVDHCTEPTHRI